MTHFLRINLCISVIALLISSVPAQATPMYYDVFQKFQDGSTSRFNFTYDSENYELTNVSKVRIKNSNGRINVPLEIAGAIPTDPDFGSAVLMFIFNNSTTNLIEGLLYNGQTSSFDEAAALITDDREDFIQQNWSMYAGGPRNGGNIKINGKPLGFVFSEPEDDDIPVASVPEPNIVVLLLAGLFGYSLTGYIKKTLSGKNRKSSSSLTI